MNCEVGIHCGRFARDIFAQFAASLAARAVQDCAPVNGLHNSFFAIAERVFLLREQTGLQGVVVGVSIVPIVASLKYGWMPIRLDVEKKSILGYSIYM